MRDYVSPKESPKVTLSGSCPFFAAILHSELLLGFLFFSFIVMVVKGDTSSCNILRNTSWVFDTTIVLIHPCDQRHYLSVYK